MQDRKGRPGRGRAHGANGQPAEAAETKMRGQIGTGRRGTGDLGRKDCEALTVKETHKISLSGDLTALAHLSLKD